MPSTRKACMAGRLMKMINVAHSRGNANQSHSEIPFSLHLIQTTDRVRKNRALETMWVHSTSYPSLAGMCLVQPRWKAGRPYLWKKSITDPIAQQFHCWARTPEKFLQRYSRNMHETTPRQKTGNKYIYRMSNCDEFTGRISYSSRNKWTTARWQQYKFKQYIDKS